MNKRHWNTVVLDGSLPDSFISDLIVDSYRLVIQSHKKADRERLTAQLAEWLAGGSS
ncbi:MAG: MmcQ/YjbR family DNA-binding protein [Verrucomicrobiota bacterium]